MLEMVSFNSILTFLGYPWLFLPNEADNTPTSIEEESVIVLEEGIESLSDNDSSSINLGNPYPSSSLSPDLKRQVIEQIYTKQDDISLQTRK